MVMRLGRFVMLSIKWHQQIRLKSADLTNRYHSYSLRDRVGFLIIYFLYFKSSPPSVMTFIAEYIVIVIIK